MNEIGGYFELELRKEVEYHTEAIRLNSGRNALEYVLRARGYQKVFLPFYSCEVKKRSLFYYVSIELKLFFY